MKLSAWRLISRLSLRVGILAIIAAGAFFGWRSTHRPAYQTQNVLSAQQKKPPANSANENSAHPSAEESPAEPTSLILESPDVVIFSQNLAALPHDLMAIPFVKGVVTEDLVNYYEDNADRLGIKGSLKRIAFEHELTWSEQLLESILAKPAEVALWRAGNGKLDYFALVIERHPLEAILESLAKVALSDTQLQQAGNLTVEKQWVPLYALRYMPKKTLFFAAYKEKLLVLSDSGLILGANNQPDPGSAELYADWLTKDSIPQHAFHLKKDDSAVQKIALKANYLSFGYQHFFPNFQAVSLRYDGTSWSSALAQLEKNWASNGDVWSGMPAEASACATLPFEEKAVIKLTKKLLNSDESAKTVLNSMQPPLAICWFNASRLYAPLIIAAIKPETRAALEPIIAESFTRFIGMQEPNLATDDGSVQDPRFNVNNLDWDASVKVWQRPVGSEYGLIKAKNFDQPDSLANTHFFKPTLMVSDKYIAFSPDADLVQQALKTWMKRFPAQADTFSNSNNVLLTFNPKEMAGLLQKETFSSLPKNYEAIFRAAAEQHLIPKLEKMATQDAWVAEVDTADSERMDDWSWFNVKWSVWAH